MDSQQQKIQDEDYSFPYHYVPQFSPGFTQTYSWTWGLYYASALEFVINRVKECGPETIVDVGTGDGRLVRELSREPAFRRVVGIDYSTRAIALARALNPTLEFLAQDITKRDFEEQFELATLIEVFEHLPPDFAPQFVTALRRLLKPNGHLLVTVPHKNLPVSAKHFQHFSEKSLRPYFEPHFVVEEVRFLNKRSQWVSLIAKILENDYFILKHWGLRNRLYLAYKKFFLLSDEAQCGRIYMRLRPKVV